MCEHQNLMGNCIHLVVGSPSTAVSSLFICGKQLLIYVDPFCYCLIKIGPFF